MKLRWGRSILVQVADDWEREIIYCPYICILPSSRQMLCQCNENIDHICTMHKELDRKIFRFAVKLASLEDPSGAKLALTLLLF